MNSMDSCIKNYYFPVVLSVLFLASFIFPVVVLEVLTNY